DIDKTLDKYRQLSFCGVVSFFFFFSSRRRHKIFDCDWSSDVCSSDLTASARSASRRSPSSSRWRYARNGHVTRATRSSTGGRRRSEERRVGKEGRAWWLVFC